MNPLVLTCTAMMAFGVMNIVPWGGPTARAITSLNLDASEVFPPLIPVMVAGLCWVFLTAFILGKKERKRLGIIKLEPGFMNDLRTEEAAALEAESSTKRPKLIWFNFVLTVLLIVGLVTSVLPLPVLFVIAFGIALCVNYPNLEEQKKRMRSHLTC